MRRTRQKSNFGVLLLINELLRDDRLPPVSLFVVAANVVIYLELLGIQFPDLYQICLSVNNIIHYKEYFRIVLAPFFHADDWHLYYNMVSFAIKGRSLEKRFGSVYFGVLLAVFTVACSLVHIALEIVAARLLQDSVHMTTCAVGFSGVIFALKVLTTHYLPSGHVYMFGTIYVPNKYVYWVELISISLLTRNVSFAGHLAGIIVGLLYIYGPLKFLIDLIVPREYQSGNRRYRANEYRNNYGWRYD